jgi:hypothetical protein
MGKELIKESSKNLNIYSGNIYKVLKVVHKSISDYIFKFK